MTRDQEALIVKASRKFEWDGRTRYNTPTTKGLRLMPETEKLCPKFHRLELSHHKLGFAKLKPDPPHTALYNTEMESSAACVCHKYTHRDLKFMTSSLPVGS